MAEAEIDASIIKMKAAWNAGDIDTVMSMYADDCSFATNVMDIKKGKANVRPDILAFIGKYATFDFTPADRVVCGNCCTEMGTFALKQKDGTVDTGKYMVGLVKRDGQWLVRFDFPCFA